MSTGQRRGRLGLFWSTAISLTALLLFLVYLFPWLSMKIVGGERPLPIPGVILSLYMILALVGGLVYVTLSNDRIRELMAPLMALLRGPRDDLGRLHPLRLGRALLLVLIPLGAGWGVYSNLSPRVATPTLLRITHPTLPRAFERLQNPFRDPTDERVMKWMAERDFTGSLSEGRKAYREAALAEGRVIFQINCRPCHGDAADGQGPMAWGLRLKPANFTDPGAIATVVEAYAFWRVTEGGPGLPPEGSPWDSAMPAWRDDLTEEQRWKAILAAYDLAGVEPRKPERAGDRAWGGESAETGASAETGKAVYVKRCLPCHGERGDGKGPVAEFLNPRPRDFLMAAYRLRTTESGEAPTDEDLLRVMDRGIAGTSMSAWPTLTAAERREVVSYIKSFNKERFASPPTPIRVSTKIDSSRDIIARGRAIYQKAKCWECHGDEGRGDGPSAGQLKTDEGFRIRPTNLTKWWRYKGGHEAADIFIRLTTGLNGTPMPSYADALSEEERWELAHYVRSIQREGPGQEIILKASRIRGDLPTDPHDPRWQKGRALTVPLAGQVLAKPRWQNYSVDAVTVRALYNDAAIAFLLVWDDPSQDAEHRPASPPDRSETTYPKIDPEEEPTQRLRDAIRLQFPVEIPQGPEKPHFFLGSPGRPVTLWHWKADLNADPARKTAVEEEYAEGFQSPIIIQPGQRVEGKGVWEQGEWKVVMVRLLHGTERGKDITFEVGKLIPFALHAWDGANGEQGLRMSLSSWNFLLLETPIPVTVYVYSLLGIGIVGVLEWSLIRWVRPSGKEM